MEKGKARNFRYPFPLSAIHRAKKWWDAGDPIPETHRKSMWEIIALDLFGLVAIMLPILSYLEIINPLPFKNVLSLIGVCLLTWIPGLYMTICTIGCWRRIPGFSWGMIPYFD